MAMRLSVLLLISALSGCRSTQALDLPAGTESPPSVGQPVHYALACPDVVQIQITSRPELNGVYPINAEGRITLPVHGALRVEGLSTKDLEATLARLLGIGKEQVTVRVKEYRSGLIFVFGPTVEGRNSAVAYQGPETVVEVLQRVGGLEPGAALHEIHVIRPSVAGGEQPLLFPIELDARGRLRNPERPLRVQPNDEIYIGETRKLTWLSAVPRWLRPVYKVFWGLIPRGRNNRQLNESIVGSVGPQEE